MITHVLHHLQNLFVGFAKAHHQAGFGENPRRALLRAVEQPISLDEWEPFDDKESGEEAIRAALEDAIKNADRIVIFTVKDMGEGRVQRGTMLAQRRSRKLHWFTLYGALTEWLQRWAHQDFEH